MSTLGDGLLVPRKDLRRIARVTSPIQLIRRSRLARSAPARRLRGLLLDHGELLKFGFVGAITFVIDTAVFYALKLGVLEPKPVTAKVIAVLVATVVSYVLNREWSFRFRGGREAHHEAALYFAFSAVGVALYAAPLWVSRYVLLLHTPFTSRLVEEIADFTSGQVVGLLLGMAFRWWAFRKWVFPNRDCAICALDEQAPEPDAADSPRCEAHEWRGVREHSVL